MNVEHIVEPKRRVVGMADRSQVSDEIPKLWDRFVPRMQEIAISGECFGVIRSTGDGWEYLACFESTGDAPEGMEVWDLPGGHYLRVQITSLDELRPTMHRFYAEFLPESEYEGADRPTLEHYPPSFPERPEMNLLFAVEPKA